jgi:hypothetical protein
MVFGEGESFDKAIFTKIPQEENSVEVALARITSATEEETSPVQELAIP